MVSDGIHEFEFGPFQLPKPAILVYLHVTTDSLELNVCSYTIITFMITLPQSYQ